MAAWRLSQGIYVFDPLIAEELSRTVADEPIPGEVLLRLPEWCIYIAAAEGPLANWGLNGCFAYLTYSGTKREAALRFLFDLEGDRLLATLPIRLNTMSIQESVEQALAESGSILGAAGLDKEFDVRSIDPGQWSREMAPLVNLVLYICSANADIVDMAAGQGAQSRPMPTKTRKGLRIFPPNEIALREVGFRVGAAVRQAHGQLESGTQHSEVRPHLRRAHWHSFWTGPRSEAGSRALRIKWLPPILVNAQEAGYIPTVRIIGSARKPDQRQSRPRTGEFGSTESRAPADFPSPSWR